LINLLRARGSCIQQQKYDEMRKIENQISQLKNEEYAKFTRPVCAFIIFEEEDGQIIADEFEPEFTWDGKQLPAKIEFLGDGLFFIDATEPTNIIWENRHFTPKERFTRAIKATAIIVLLILVSFAIIVACKSVSIAFNSKYPAINQELYELAYGEELGHYAQEEYINSEIYGGRYYLTGVLKAYCDNSSNPVLGATVDGDEVDNICTQYTNEKYLALFMSQSISQIIVAVNFVLRLFIVKCVQYMGLDTESSQTQRVTKGVFVV
jgi:hypothetical protein